MGDAPTLALLAVAHMAQTAIIAVLAWATLRSISVGSAQQRLRLACVAFYGAALLPLTALLPQHVSVSVGQGAPSALWAAPTLGDAPAWFSLLSGVMLTAIAAGMIWRLGQTVLAVARGERLAARAITLPAEQFGLPRDARVALSRDVAGPAVAGLLRPTILLPSRLEHAPRETLFALMHHEYAHLVRRDVRNALVQRVVEDVFWWNPAMRILGRRLSEARELACDEMACATVEPRIFAGSLIEEARTRAARSALVVPAGGDSVVRRLERLIEPRSARAILSAAALAFAILAIGAISTPRPSITNATHLAIASS